MAESYVCCNCNRRRFGVPPINPNYPPGSCPHCHRIWDIKATNKANKKGIEPLPKDYDPDLLSTYHRLWERQKGKCTSCRRHHKRMYFMCSTCGKITGLRCRFCIRPAIPKKRGLPNERPPVWFQQMPAFMREVVRNYGQAPVDSNGNSW